MADDVRGTHHEFISAEEVDRIEKDPVLTVDDVLSYREANNE